MSSRAVRRVPAAPTRPNPTSLRQRGRRHNDEEHPAEFSSCLECWPGAVLCGDCGHVTVDGRHGHLVVDSRLGLQLRTQEPCHFPAYEFDRQGSEAPRCGCTRRSRAPRVRVIEPPEPLPLSSGRPTPRPFPVPSFNGHQRSLRGRRL